MNTSTSRSADTGARLVSVARSIEAASLNLIHAVDETVDALIGLTSIMTGFNRMISSIREEVVTATPAEGAYLDPVDESIDALEHASNSLKDQLTWLVRKRASIDTDQRMKDHHCESLHDAYQQAIEAVAELAETCVQMRAAIIRHDLAAEPRNGSAFDTAAALIENLRNA